MRYQQVGSALVFPLHLNMSTIIIIIFVMYLISSTSNGHDDGYDECSLQSCGNILNIGYPFWGQGCLKPWRPKYCGHPAFELTCPDGDEPPILHIYNSSYQILSINYSTKTIMLREFHLDDPHDPHHCLIPTSNLTTVPGKFIEYSTKVEDITLLHGCENLIKRESGLVYTCSTDEGESTTTYYYEKNKETEDELRHCQHIQVPLIGKDNLTQGNITLLTALERGFEANYSTTYLRHCFACEESGGKCGCSPYLSFVCFCEGGWDSHSDCRKSGKNFRLILGIGIPGLSLFIIIALVVGLFYLKKRKFHSQTLLSRRTSGDYMNSDLEFGTYIPVFSYSELQEATNNFDPARELGDGGFGVVYHGKLRDGREVAVKRLFERNYKRVEQFRNEVEILTTLSHPNLVTLYGCTSRHSRELLLVYEYIPNGTVADHLYGDRSDSRSLTWAIRMKIAIQTAGALSYLHATEIIHRDIKTNNILLDDNFSVKVADFGLSRLFPFDATHVSTAPQGTPGYLDPEYHKCYQVTNKSDVYSFGVVLIELISSLPAIDISRDEDEINLSTYAINKIQHSKLRELVDERLGFDSDSKVKRTITLVAELAFQCLQQEREVRPSMEEVLEALKRIESVDYEALEKEEMSRGFEISKSTSEAAGNDSE